VSVTVPVGVGLPPPPLTETVTATACADVIVDEAGVTVTVGVVVVEVALIFNLTTNGFTNQEVSVVWNAPAVTGKSNDWADPVTYTLPELSTTNARAWSPSPKKGEKLRGVTPSPP